MRWVVYFQSEKSFLVSGALEFILPHLTSFKFVSPIALKNPVVKEIVDVICKYYLIK